VNIQEHSLALFTDPFITDPLKKIMNVSRSGCFGWGWSRVVDPDRCFVSKGSPVTFTRAVGGSDGIRIITRNVIVIAAVIITARDIT
jgi:hypothetical protein